MFRTEVPAPPLTPIRLATTVDRKHVLLLAVIAFPLLLSVDLENLSSLLENAVNAWKILSTVVVAFLYVNGALAGRPIATHLLPMVAIMVMLLFSTLLNSGSISRYAIVWGGFFAVALLVESNIRERPRELLLALKLVLGAIAIANCISVVLRPEGLWQNGEDAFWLLGHRNNFGAPLIAAIAVAAAYDFVSRCHLSVSTVVIAVASLASVVRTWSASSVLTVALVTVVMMLIAVSRNGATALRPFLLLGVYAAVDVGIVVFHIQEQASALIETVLNRSSDLTGRTRIWDLVFVMIQDSPLFGNGVQRAENNGLTVVDPNFVHAHNGELNLLLEGGLLTFVPFVVLVLIVTRNAARDYRSRAVQMLYLGLIISMVRAIQGLFFSSYSVLLVFLLLNAAIVARLEFEGERPRPIARGASAG